MDQSNAKHSKSSHWGVQRRLTFIDFRLHWEGRINRSDLQDFFGISTPQASADIKRYSELAPENITYDKSERAFLATNAFRPKFTSDRASAYLHELVASHTGTLPSDICFIGNRPSFDTVPFPHRHVEARTLIALLGAIRAKQALAIRYQSMSRDAALWRQISPHALGHDGLRFHVRAYCHERLGFRDFVLSRILDVGQCHSSDIDEGEDSEWHERVLLRIAPHDGLSPAQREAVEREFEMSAGERAIEVRGALLFYLLVRLRLDEFREMRTPRAQQIRVVNPEELGHALPPPFSSDT